MLSDHPGSICWMELMADDPTLLLSFYQELLGWTFADPMPMNGGEYISCFCQWYEYRWNYETTSPGVTHAASMAQLFFRSVCG